MSWFLQWLFSFSYPLISTAHFMKTIFISNLDIIGLLWWLRGSHLPAMRETWVRSLGGEDPLEKEMATHSSILAWKTPWTEKPGGLQSMLSQSWTWLHFHFLLDIIWYFRLISVSLKKKVTYHPTLEASSLLSIRILIPKHAGYAGNGSQWWACNLFSLLKWKHK